MIALYRVWEAMKVQRVTFASVREVLFDNIPNLWNTNPDGSPGNVMAAEPIAENPDKKIGTAIMLHTMPGDHFDISVKSFYEGEGIPEETVTPEDVVSSLFSTLTGGGTYGGVPVTDLPDNLNTHKPYWEIWIWPARFLNCPLPTKIRRHPRPI